MTFQDSGCSASDDGRRSGKSRVLSRCVRSSSDMACRPWSNTWWERSRERGFFSSHLVSSHLISSHLISSHGLLTRTASYPSILRCRAFRAGPPRRRDVPRQKELGEKSRATLRGTQSRELAQAGVGEKRSGSGSALSLRKCQAARIKISTTTEALFFFHSQHKCFGKRRC